MRESRSLKPTVLPEMQLTHHIQIESVFQAIGGCLMAIVNGIGAILKGTLPIFHHLA